MGFSYRLKILTSATVFVALTSCATSPSDAPVASPSLSASKATNLQDFYKQFVIAKSVSESGWDSWEAAQAQCLSLPNRRGNLKTFKACYSEYIDAYRTVLDLSKEYINYLNEADVPSEIQAEFSAYQFAVTAADTRFRALFEVFCTTEPHSTLDWYNCVGSNDVSESWEYYFQIQDQINPELKKLSDVFEAAGLPALAID